MSKNCNTSPLVTSRHPCCLRCIVSYLQLNTIYQLIFKITGQFHLSLQKFIVEISLMFPRFVSTALISAKHFRRLRRNQIQVIQKKYCGSWKKFSCERCLILMIWNKVAHLAAHAYYQFLHAPRLPNNNNFLTGICSFIDTLKIYKSKL